MSKDLGLLPMTPQTGHCARAASQAVLKADAYGHRFSLALRGQL
jgi:hypothetical protein